MLASHTLVVISVLSSFVLLSVLVLLLLQLPELSPLDVSLARSHSASSLDSWTNFSGDPRFRRISRSPRPVGAASIMKFSSVLSSTVRAVVCKKVCEVCGFALCCASEIDETEDDDDSARSGDGDKVDDMCASRDCVCCAREVTNRGCMPKRV
jgi:hypothetical protein